ncbi:helix-turn-helix domain-containing protein [Rahnella aceris]|uniref:helix-turn-helix domain-containing protein n=1 Tax=Rahnella sp. (strain Y9602) TaxID=2703885 RepID=UPI001C27FFDA|nr:helix-turn-helix domain-containing protein [Rahnella aceris]MBU9858511.1 helix-turn-helix domain-containing protein [Rahnella aceris]
MAKISISEASRLTGKSRTTLHRLIKAGELSSCSGVRNTKLLDTSELLRVFGTLSSVQSAQLDGQVAGQKFTGDVMQSEQVNQQLTQEVEHLRELVTAQQSHIDSLKQAMLLLEHKKEIQPVAAASDHSPWWRFWKS